jgi:hypothetical protein
MYITDLSRGRDELISLLQSELNCSRRPPAYEGKQKGTTKKMFVLKGLSYEKEFKYFDKNLKF